MAKISADPLATTLGGIVMAGVQDGQNVKVPAALFGTDLAMFVNGDGSDESEGIIEAIAAAKAVDQPLICRRRMAITFAAPLSLSGIIADFGGSILTYEGDADEFALVVDVGDGHFRYGARHFTLRSESQDTENRTHGICLGGSNGSLENVRVEGFTGISLALGSGEEAYTGVDLPASAQCYYWSVSNLNIAATAGWGLVIKNTNNANRFFNLSTFPFNGFGDATPRRGNCINELYINGIDNQFYGLSLEAAPTGARIKFGSNGSRNYLPRVYVEDNSSFDVPPLPTIEAHEDSSANFARLGYTRHGRHFGNGVTTGDLGVANDFGLIPAYSVNGQQHTEPRGGPSIVTNGDFSDGTTGWTDFGTGCVTSISEGGGYYRGNALRLELTDGRPHITQDIVSVGGINLAALKGKNITVGVWLKTNIAGVKPRLAGQTGNAGTTGDEEPEFVSVTTKIRSGATSVPVAITTEASGLTGYVEIMGVAANIGLDVSPL